MKKIEDEEGEHEELTIERFRRGLPVIRTTVELEKNLYIKVKEEVSKSNISIREFLSKAASERLARMRRSIRELQSDIEVLKDMIRQNEFASKVLDHLEKEIPGHFGIAILLSRIDKYDLDLDLFSVDDLTEALIDDLCKPVDYLNGPTSATNLRNTLEAFRRG